MLMISRFLGKFTPLVCLGLLLSSCDSPYTLSSGDARPEEYSFEQTQLSASAADIASIQNANGKPVTSSVNDLAALADKQMIGRVADKHVSKAPQLSARTVIQPNTKRPDTRNISETAVAAEIGKLKSNASAEVQNFYNSRGNAPVWRNKGQWVTMASSVESSLINSEDEGLPARRYLALGNFNTRAAQTALDIAKADLALTEASMLYLVDLSDGLDPEKTRGDGKRRLLQALRSGDWNSITAGLRPTNRQYRGLAKVMQSGALTEDQKKTVMINMERFRTYTKPTDPRFIHVNLPTQSLTGYDKAKVAIDMPVVIGQLSRQTPVMTDRITNLKFSPDWSVPASIAKKDLFPIIKEKGSALTKAMNLKVYKGSRLVDPDKENWKNAKSSSYRFYQPPGKGNALGGVRFSLTNPRGIYLHDTPSRDLFSRSTRVVSSGCVRVGDAEGLATWLMQGTEWNRARVQKAMKRGKTQIVNLRKDVPVYFTYHTAQVDPQGRFQMGDDIYALDAALGIRLGIF